MRKWVIAFLAGIVLLLGALYIFIPNVIAIKSRIDVNATGAGLHRMLLDKGNIHKWWPGKISNDSLYLNDFSYKIMDGNITFLRVVINGKNTDLTSSLFLVSIFTDSTRLGWIGTMPASYNPVKRLQAYVKAKKIKRDMAVILKKMKAFYSKPENIYGSAIKKVSISDTFYIAYLVKCKGYPTTKFLYGYIEKLRNYATSNGAKENGYPITNIRSQNNEDFNLIIALPIDKILPSSGDILQRKLPGCCLLVTEVKGGVGTVTRAFNQMQHYMDDYKRKAPALPFYSLITDRANEADTSKWITKICFPVM